MQRCVQRIPPRLPRPVLLGSRPPSIRPRAVRTHQRRPCVRVCAAKTLYEVLGVQQTATSRDIKTAYRKLALKLHPDVNKAPDAKDRFIEAKRAFETLADDKSRADYDRQLRMGSMGGGWGSTYGSSYSSSSSSGGSSYRRPNTPAEDDYSFDDLVRDLEKEFSSWSASRTSGQPKSIWDDIESLGGELLDFVEDSLGIKEEEAAKGKGSSTSSSASSSTTGSTGSSSSSSSAGASGQEARPKSSTERFDDFVRMYDTPPSGSGSGSGSGSSGGGGTSSGGARTGAGASTGAGGAGGGSKQKSSSSDDIDDMLLALKKKLNKL